MRARARAAVLAIGLGLACELAPMPCAAWCRSTTCKDGKICVPAEADPGFCTPDEPICGDVAIAWPKSCAGFVVQEAGSKQITADDARAVLREAFATWESAPCGDGTPRVHVEDLGTVRCGGVEYNREGGGNANVVVFRDDVWPHKDRPDALALTTVSYDPDTGAIVDADMEINTAGFDFSTDGSTDADLLAVVTHEAGHFLGLAHTNVAGGQPTMTASYQCGGDTLAFRDLAEDDIGAICAAYPPSGGPPISADCNPLPKHGLSPDCEDEQKEGDCAVTPGAPRDGSTELALLLLSVLGVRSRRRTR